MTQKLLFVCLGNICRSPTAEAIVRSKAGARGLALEVDSAGTGAWHIGDAPDLRMQAAASKAGYDLSALRARQVVAQDFSRFDLILAMDSRNMDDLLHMRPRGSDVPVALFLPYGPTGHTDVPDPYYEGGFDRIVALIETAAEGLLDRIAS